MDEFFLEIFKCLSHLLLFTCILQSKNFIDNMLREEQKEKTAMVEIIQKLQDENRGKNEEIVELKEQVRLQRVFS